MAKGNRIIAVTGASGFVGRVLVERLLRGKSLHMRYTPLQQALAESVEEIRG
jgi:nucleoside-diphosphate-sugar epimerase